MFGNKKKKILENGTQAKAIVIDVADTGVTINNNPRVKLTLQVQPEGAAPFEATKKVTVSRVSIPSIGDSYFVRFDPSDPSEVEFDQTRVNEVNAEARAQLAQAAASAVPADLAERGILGRGALVDVQRNPTGELVDCVITAGVRLVDGTPPYRATCRVSLSPENAERMIPMQTLFTVRADPNDHSRVAISLSEPTPTITINDPSAIDPPARALRDGTPCRLVLVAYSSQFLRQPTGEVLYAAKVRVLEDSSEQQILLPVPDTATSMLENGRELPGKRVIGDAAAMTVDWAAARSQSGAVLA